MLLFHSCCGKLCLLSFSLNTSRGLSISLNLFSKEPSVGFMHAIIFFSVLYFIDFYFYTYFLPILEFNLLFFLEF